MKSSEGLFLSIKFSLDYFKKKTNDFSVKNDDRINIINNLNDENDKLKQDAEMYYVKYEKMKEKYYKLKQVIGNSQNENNNYEKVIKTTKFK